MKAIIIIYDTCFGNTHTIAKSPEVGLKQAAHIRDAISMNSKDVRIDSLSEYDPICIGPPTEEFTASKAIKEFLRKLKEIDLSGKYCFTFDTKLDSRFSDSATKYIEKELVSHGLRILAPLKSVIVFALKEKGAIVDARLKEAEEKRFEEIGIRLEATTTIVQSETQKQYNIKGGNLSID